MWLDDTVSRPTQYSFGRARRDSGGWFHWLLVLVMLGVLGWIIWDYSRVAPASRAAALAAPPERPLPSPPPLPPVPGDGTMSTNGGKTPPRVAISSNLYTLIPRPEPTPEPGFKFIIPPTPTNASQPVTTITPITPTNLIHSTKALLEAQIALARRGISPGSIDGKAGSQTRAALLSFQRQENLPPTGVLDEATKARLAVEGPLFTTYVLKAEDLTRLQPLGTTWLSKSQQSRLDYENALELVAEKFHAHPAYIRQLNPTIDWHDVPAGTELKVPNVVPPVAREKAAYIGILLSQRQLEVYNSRSNLLAQFPCSIAKQVEKRPVGELHITRAAPNPTYLFNPEIFPESEEAQQLNRKLTLQPGPNNPVGTVWIGLDRPGYGIHGTPRPEDVGRTESHGCFRLANWNAELLLKLVRVGTPVFVEP